MAQIIALAIAVVTGITLLLKYLLSPKRKIEQIEEQIKNAEEAYKQALARNDTVDMSLLDVDLRRLRAALNHIAKR